MRRGELSGSQSPFGEVMVFWVGVLEREVEREVGVETWSTKSKRRPTGLSLT